MQSFHEIHRQFRDAVEMFLAESGMTPTRFGALAAKDPSFVFDLRDGRACGPTVMDRVVDFMRENHGKKAADIEREAA